MIASTFKLDTWYEATQTSKVLFGDENAISEMMLVSTAQADMLSVGLYTARVGDDRVRVIALAGPGGKTDPRSRGFSALNYVGADQLEPAHTNRARVAKWADLKVERKLRRREQSSPRDSRFQSPSARPVDSTVLTRSPVDEEARDNARFWRVSAPAPLPPSGNRKVSAGSLAAQLASAEKELRIRVSSHDTLANEAAQLRSDLAKCRGHQIKMSLEMSDLETQLTVTKEGIDTEVSERAKGLIGRAAAAATRTTDALRKQVGELEAEVERLRPYETMLNRFKPAGVGIIGWNAATEKAEAGAHHYRYNNLGNGKGVWRFKEKQM